MRLRTLIRTAVIMSIVLLCAGFAAYSFFRMNAAEHRQDFNLYTLVPQDATVVLETDRVAELVESINEMRCSKENHFLYVSELFVYLKKYLHTFAGDVPHGLSRQMNKMLLSFHEPDSPYNQVLYCSLGAGDYELVESFVQKYASGNFPSKRFDYRGEEIRIYPVADGHFLAAYCTSDFLVLSFQKRLIEQVIDARRSRRSLADVPSFRAMQAEKRARMAATLYVRMKEVDMGKDADGERSQTKVGSWAEFDMKFAEDAIYCSGVSHGADSTGTFIDALRMQQPVEGFPGDRLPVSTFFYDCWAVSDAEAIFGFTTRQEYAKTAYSAYIQGQDSTWISFLNEHGSEQMMSCLFQPKDTADKRPCAVMSIPMRDVRRAERRLQSLLYASPREADAPPLPASSPEYKHYPRARWHRQYVLPRNTLLTQLTGITESALYTYACFHKEALLLAPDARSLSAYIDALESGAVLDGIPAYEEGVGSLSPVYSFLMMVDMGEMARQPDAYARLVPHLFFRQIDFFRHFILSIQFTCTEGVVYPNIVLLYRGE